MPEPGATVVDRYRVERELGAGGMATVYLAHDVRHDRKVALKVLRPELAAVIGAARFLAEIRTTANLQHPHILPLYDSGESDGSVFYVMPFVTGESLRDRLKREKQLPVDEAIRIAGEVADALDYAHRQGVVHRDIKPDNILLHDGRALIADFGIALAVSRSDSSTRLTETGMSLGTPHYMSPEQAMGDHEVTPRSDVYALGCVLYEMLAGEPPFTGPTAQAIVARVMTDAPRSLVAQRHTVTRSVEAVVHRALEKLPADRFASAAQFAEALRNPGVATALGADTLDAAAARSGRAVDLRARAFLPLGALFVIASGLALWGWLRPEPAPPVSRYALYFALQEAPTGMIQLSRSGAGLVYLGPREAGAAAPTSVAGNVQLWMKARDRAEPVPIPGTEGVSGFAISPDEQSVATTSGQALALSQLKRLPLAGGPSVTLADSVLVVGHSWLDDGTIVFSRPAAGGAPSLWRVPADGGPAAHLWTPDSAAVPALPSPLPGSRGVLVTRLLGTRPAVWIVEVPSGKARRVIDDALFAMFVPPGHLVYGRADGALLAVPFDLGALEVRGTPVPLMDDVEVMGGVIPQFTVSLDGTLIVQSRGAGRANAWNAVWVDRSGRQEVIDSAWRFNPHNVDQNVGWALSPDGERLAIGLSTNGNADIFVKQLPNGPLTRITFDSLPDVRPRWTPDGRAITYLSGTLGSRRLHQRNADGSGADTVLLSHAGSVLDGAWSRDRRWLLARVGEGGNVGEVGNRDIIGLRPGSDTAPVPLVATNFQESAVALSPDSRWLAYESDEAGASEVFIRPFPNTDSGKSQVSTNGGFAPLWSRDGRELFYMSPRREMMAVTVGPGATPQLGERRVLFTLPTDLWGGFPEYYTPHDISPDGSRFVMVRRVAGDDAAVRMIVVENFAEELKARARRQ